MTNEQTKSQNVYVLYITPTRDFGAERLTEIMKLYAELRTMGCEVDRAYQTNVPEPYFSEITIDMGELAIVTAPSSISIKTLSKMGTSKKYPRFYCYEAKRLPTTLEEKIK